jgi:hypothetical protein
VLARLRQLRVLLPAERGAGGAETLRLHPDVQARLREALYDLSPPPPPALPPHLQVRGAHACGMRYVR